MNQLSQLKDLIKDNKLEEAKSVLKTILERPLSEEERGEAIVTLTMVYVEVKNSLDKEFMESYEKTMKAIKDITLSENMLKNAQKLEEVRKNLE